MYCGGVLGYHKCEGKSVQNLVCAPKMGSSLTDNPDETKTSVTVTCRLWEDLMCPAPVTGHQRFHRCGSSPASLWVRPDPQHPSPVWLWQMSINRVFSQVVFPVAGWIYCVEAADIQSWLSKPSKPRLCSRGSVVAPQASTDISWSIIWDSSLHYPHRGEWTQEPSWYCRQVCRWLFQVAEWQLEHVKIIWPCLKGWLEPRFTRMALLLAQYKWLQLWKAGAQPCSKAKALPNHHGTQGLMHPAVSWLGT